MEPHKRRSLDSLDELGSEAESEIFGGSLEDITIPTDRRSFRIHVQSECNLICFM